MTTVSILTLLPLLFFLAFLAAAIILLPTTLSKAKKQDQGNAAQETGKAIA